MTDIQIPTDDEPPGAEEPHRRTRSAAVIAVVAVVVAVFAVGTSIGLVIGQRGNDQAAPLAATSTASRTPSPSPSRDSYGENACRDLEALEASNYGWDAAYIMKLEAIAVSASRASHEDVREQGDALRETLRPDTIPASEMIRIDQQTLDLVRACDEANYAF